MIGPEHILLGNVHSIVTEEEKEAFAPPPPEVAAIMPPPPQVAAIMPPAPPPQVAAIIPHRRPRQEVRRPGVHMMVLRNNRSTHYNLRRLK